MAETNPQSHNTAWGRTSTGTYRPILIDADGTVHTTGSGGGGGGAVTVADGADVTQGALADASVTGDNSGTLSAKLRGISTILADVWDSVNNWVRVSVQGNATVVQPTASSLNAEVQGDAAHDATVSGNPLTAGFRASIAVPTAVSADGDAVYGWANLQGAQVTTAVPHVGLLGDPWSQVHGGAQYTTQQTSTIFVDAAAGERVVVTQLQIQAFGTTAFDIQIYFGTGAFSRGTSRTCFDGTFKPSTTFSPGVVLQGPFISGVNGDDLRVTTSAGGSVTVSVWYYVVG